LAEAEAFDEDTPPSASMLFYASLLEIVDEHGRMVRFGDLVRQRRTIVIFIRHCESKVDYWSGRLGLNRS